MDCLNLDQPLDYNSLAYFLNALTAFTNLKDAISCHLYTNYKTQVERFVEEKLTFVKEVFIF